ncbi:hypothetical protein Pst134EA_031674 [Puccinia striiformis f. sp. tritici]|uniref:uncharacterized protein n=1 Tax=Puccinia striiformis f. sp. tritici TaxID=168172 RepID=UPI002007F7B7|nr:uncharacterized protein Pst134EA_031674 [Puccinia striiformis f. sp. tritici]KAH9442661.1 hypothetical protein Pst134EA_031674 [Puccinia striiformis f. sp. tritici]
MTLPPANGTDGIGAITDALQATTMRELGRKVRFSLKYRRVFVSKIFIASSEMSTNWFYSNRHLAQTDASFSYLPRDFSCKSASSHNVLGLKLTTRPSLTAKIIGFFVGTQLCNQRRTTPRSLLVYMVKSPTCKIIHRGTRSLGYGFVTFATREESENAVAAMIKPEIDGRAINVEIAKPAPAENFPSSL